MTTLYDLRQSDWNQTVEECIKEWLQHKKLPLLSIYFDERNLCATLGVPTTRIVDMMYFAREPGEVFDVHTFHDVVVFGLLDSDIEGAILHTISNVYLPVFLETTRWPNSKLLKSTTYFC